MTADDGGDSMVEHQWGLKKRSLHRRVLARVGERSMMAEKRMLNAKVMVYMFLTFSVLMLVFGAVMYFAAERVVLEQLRNRCKGVAVSVATMVEQDTGAYQEFIRTLDTQSDYYKRIKRDMEKIKVGNKNNIRFIYTEVKVSDTEMMYVLDGEVETAAMFSPPGSTAGLTPVRQEAYDTQVLVMGDEFTSNEFGVLLSVYAPIIDNATGEFIGLAGADISKEQYDDIMRYIWGISLGSLVIMIMMAGTVILLSTASIERMITIDALTGVYNRAFFMQSLKYQMKLAEKRKEPLVVFMADLDHFKNINDTYGHLFGDVVLETISQVMNNSLRKYDCLARYGGEEFAAYLPNVSLAEAKEVVMRIREKVEKTKMYNEETDAYVSITISIGVAEVTQGITMNTLLENADKALYKAKESRNQVICYGDKDVGEDAARQIKSYIDRR